MIVRHRQTLRLGLKSLLLHKLRSGLAVLGILIGVTAVIWLVAMGEGVSYQAQQQIKDLGATNIIVRSVKPSQTSSDAAAGSFFVEYGLTWDDYRRITSTIPTVSRAVPLRELPKEVRYLDRALDARIVGCRPEYLEMNRLRMARGRFLEDRDLAEVDNVAVIAAETARQLFPYENPLGKKLLIDTQFYTIVGETEERSATGNIGGSFSGQDYNRDVYIPLSTLEARIGKMVLTARAGAREGEIVELSQVTVTVDELGEVDQTAELIDLILKPSHKLRDYALVVPKELLEQAENTRLMFNILLVLIAGTALVVGGIGIMNIMLATVTERTREIGIRRALGAKRRDIVEQFLIETVVLSATGGVLGVALGLCCPAVFAGAEVLLERFVPETMASLPPNLRHLEPRIAPWSVAAAFLISVAVGVVFGLYPAYRASRMDPIEALRHE